MSIEPQQSTQTKAFGMWVVFPWLAGSLAAYFLTSFFSNFYPAIYSFILLSAFFQILCGTTAILLFDRSEEHIDPLAVLALLVAFALPVAAALISWQFPGLFHRRILFMDGARVPIFVLLTGISLGASLTLLKTIERNGVLERFERTLFFRWLQENRPGLLLAILFLVTYLIFAETMNFPGFRTLDQFFDTDISEWLARLTDAIPPEKSTVRAVHPAVLLFLRPLVWLLSIFLNGDRLQAVFVMNALAGAGCVLLTWLIVKRASDNTAYSLIMAALLGASASHLLLSSMLETYIYSALALLLFTFLIQHQYTALKYTVPIGIVVFGITVTNLIQTCLLYIFNYPRIKVILRYILIVTFSVILLNLAQARLYPNARSLFRHDNVTREGYYILNPFDASWRTVGRLALIARAIPLYGVVAPTPFILTKELGVDVPNFRTYHILLGEFHVAGYRGLADVTVKLWMVILAVAGLVFLWNLFKTPKQIVFPLSLLLCLGFSFSLHAVYGDDPMLYSPNWVYALILFIALILQRWADRRWLQLALIVFLVLLMSANLGLIHQIMQVSAPFYSVGN